MKIPVTVYSEITPNPSTMKFVANKYILPSGESANFTSQSQTMGYSPLAEELFRFPFVDGVFLAANFVTITKTNNVSWDFITMQIREFVRDWISESKEILLKSQDPALHESQDGDTKVPHLWRGLAFGMVLCLIGTRFSSKYLGIPLHPLKRYWIF